MGNREIEKIGIDGYDMRQAINESGYSLRKLGELTSRSDRQIRHYLDSGEMPAFLYDDICRVIGYEPQKSKDDKHVGNLVKRLKNGINQSKGVDGDFVYITVGDAKRILKKLEEEKDG